VDVHNATLMTSYFFTLESYFLLTGQIPKYGHVSTLQLYSGSSPLAPAHRVQRSCNSMRCQQGVAQSTSESFVVCLGHSSSVEKGIRMIPFDRTGIIQYQAFLWWVQ